MSEELIFLSASELAAGIKAKKFTSEQVVSAYINHIESLNPKLNSIVTLDKENAITKSQEADEALNAGKIWGPLHGVPITIKDSFETKNIRTTASHPPLQHNIPNTDATVVKKIKEAGAIILGKTNMPELAMDYQTNSPVFGTANNVWDLTRTTGGSTGGGANAVASGMSPLEIGSDIGGSLRVPAHFCGIFSIKPTGKLVSEAGHIPELPNEIRRNLFLQAFGPLARSLDDIELALPIIAGPDNRDQYVPPISLEKQPVKKIKELKIAWSDDFGGVPITKDTRDHLSKIAADLSAAGAHVVKRNPEDFDFEEVWDTWGELMGIQNGNSMSKIFRFIVRTLGKSYINKIPMQRKAMNKITFENYIQAVNKRNSLIQSLESFLNDFDAWFCPVSCTSAFTHMEPDMKNGPVPIYNKEIMVDNGGLNYFVANQSYCTVFNVTGSPVVVLPIGRSTEGLPIGMQLVGKRWKDMKLISVAKSISKITGEFDKPDVESL